MLCHAHKFLNGTNSSWKVGKSGRWWMSRMPFDIKKWRKKKLRKPVKLFGKTNLWAFKWSLRDKETERQILHDWLNMGKVCAKMVLKTLTREQKDKPEKHFLWHRGTTHRMTQCFENVITCDKMWIFQYSLEMKRQPQLIGRHTLHQEWKKHEWASWMLRQWWSFSSTTKS
jgi:hypothetical protein